VSGLLVFPDALSQGLRVLRGSTFPEALAASYGTATPDELADDFPGTPYVSLTLLDSDTALYPYRETALVQVTAWDESASKALRLVQVARAVLVAYPGDELIAAITAKGRRGPVSDRDPDTRQPLAYCTVAIRLLPALL
jgi:hypothetical protein